MSCPGCTDEDEDDVAKNSSELSVFTDHDNEKTRRMRSTGCFWAFLSILFTRKLSKRDLNVSKCLLVSLVSMTLRYSHQLQEKQG